MTYDDKLWLKSYDPGIRAEIEIPNVSLKDYLVNTFKEFPDRSALYYLGTSMTFGELLEQSGRFAKGLNEKGLGKGDVVALNMPNVPQFLIALVGSLRAGCSISGLAPLFTPDEIAYQLNDCKAKVLVTLDMLFSAKVAGLADRIPGVELVLVAGAKDILPGVTEFPCGTPLQGKDVTAFMDFLRRYPDDPPQLAFTKDDQCYLQYTGGTTGPPKGAILSHGNMVANIAQFEHWMRFKRGEEVWLTAFPLFHLAGLFMSTCALAFAAPQVMIPDPRNLEMITQSLEKYKPNFIANVPSLSLMLLAYPEFKKCDFSPLRFWVSGASPFPVEAIKVLEGVIGEGKLVEVWGMTETSPLITVNPAQGKKKIGSVGLPLCNTRFRIVDLADGQTPVPLGEEGELIANGPQVMQGYLNQPEETRNALRVHDGDVWMHTGDVGRMDEDGFVYVVDRAKDMIIVGGYKVFSSEVEGHLYKHPVVGMCALVGLRNPERPDSEIVKLFVQKSAAYKDIPDETAEAELIAYAREKLAPYKVPRIVEFVDAIPLTSVGKVDKKVLRKRAG